MRYATEHAAKVSTRSVYPYARESLRKRLDRHLTLFKTTLHLTAQLIRYYYKHNLWSSKHLRSNLKLKKWVRRRPNTSMFVE